VKIVRHASAPQRARMRREATLAARLRHPGIVSIFDCGALPDSGFAIAMELVEGESLDAWDRTIKDSGQGLRERTRRMVRVMTRVCAALHHAHQFGVIHRDLKPSNILVGPDDQPRLVDFGLARASMVGSGQTVTRTGEFAGTLAYAAPEQLTASDSVGTAADIYALGAILYELLAGRLPIEVSGSIERAIAAVLHAEPVAVRLSAQGAPIDRELITIALKALSRDPQRRYESAAAMGADLGRWLRGVPIEARPSSALYVLSKWIRRHQMATVAVIVATLTLVAFAVVVTSLYLRADDAQRRFRGLLDASQALAAQRERVLRQAESSMADLRAIYSEERRQRHEILVESRRLGAAMAGLAIKRVDELVDRGEIESARELAWREALAPSMLPPAVARVGSGRFEAALSALRRAYADEANALGIAHVDLLIAAEVDRWINRLEASGVTVTNGQAFCAWKSIVLQE